MNILDVLTAPWAIEPAKLLEIRGIYLAHARGDKADIAGIEQRLGLPLDNRGLSSSGHANEPKRYDVIDGVDPAFALAVVWAIDRWVERD